MLTGVLERNKEQDEERGSTDEGCRCEGIGPKFIRGLERPAELLQEFPLEVGVATVSEYKVEQAD